MEEPSQNPGAGTPLPRGAKAALTVWGFLAGIIFLFVLGLLFLFNPAEYAIYPRCLFHQVTGLDCPGCGGLRAVHQLLHGHVRAALALNPLLFILSPVVAWILFREGWRRVNGRELPNLFRHPAWVWILVALVVVFSVARNLSFFHRLAR
jgi:hypothetical protein